MSLIDIDHFKRVNDTYGHGAGDQLLIAVARALRLNTRESDLVARFGGEEFCVIHESVDAATMSVLAERLRAAIAAIEFPGGVTASIGACHSTIGRSAAQLVELADTALYAAKRGGRNRVVIAG